MDLIVCGLVLFILEIFGKKPDEQKNQDLIIPILYESESGKENYSDEYSSLDLDCEDSDLYEDFGG